MTLDSAYLRSQTNVNVTNTNEFIITGTVYQGNDHYYHVTAKGNKNNPIVQINAFVDDTFFRWGSGYNAFRVEFNSGRSGSYAYAFMI